MAGLSSGAMIPGQPVGAYEDQNNHAGVNNQGLSAAQPHAGLYDTSTNRDAAGRPVQQAPSPPTDYAAKARADLAAWNNEQTAKGNLIAANGTSVGQGGYFQQQIDAINKRAPITTQYDPNAGVNQNAARGQQEQALGLSMAAAQGNAPSVAQNQYALSVQQANQAMQQNMTNSNAQAMSQAASARGGSAASAALQRQAMQQGGLNNAQATIGVNNNLQNSAIQNASLRAAEMSQARGEALAGAGQVRTGDQAYDAQGIQRSQYDQGAAARQQAADDVLKNQLAAQKYGFDAADRNYKFTQSQAASDNAYRDRALDKNIGIVSRQIDNQDTGAWLGAASGGGAALGQIISGISSDRRGKENIQAASGLMDTLEPYTFNYKNDPEAKPYLGVMAQDLEKTPQGKTAVVDTPSGKMIRLDAGLGIALAGLADMNKRLKSKGM